LHGADLFQRAVEEQQFNLREGAEIIIATPGRLKDVLERHVLVLSQCRYVVMDEADRMVHLGFEADLTFILDKLPSETMEGEDQSEQMDVDGETMVKKGRTRVTTLFSATMPPPVERLARKYLKRPAVITIGEAGRAVDTVEQRVEFVIGEEKKKCVVELLMDKVLVTKASLQTASCRNPQQWAISGAHHRFCQPEKDSRYGGKGSFSRWCASGVP
jgi:superfamily II DNA/RNA helicase